MLELLESEEIAFTSEYSPSELEEDPLLYVKPRIRIRAWEL
jgi:hypothetical protein